MPIDAYRAGDEFVVMFDLPGVTRELAVWHQDYRYVRGNTDIVTAWVPLQDTPYVRGISRWVDPTVMASSALPGSLIDVSMFWFTLRPEAVTRVS